MLLLVQKIKLLQSKVFCEALIGYEQTKSFKKVQVTFFISYTRIKVGFFF